MGYNALLRAVTAEETPAPTVNKIIVWTQMMMMILIMYKNERLLLLSGQTNLKSATGNIVTQYNLSHGRVVGV